MLRSNVPFSSIRPHVRLYTFLPSSFTPFLLYRLGFPHKPHPSPLCRQFFLNSSSMQRRSTPSFVPPSSCYPIPHSQITIPPCIPCITDTNLLPKKDKICRSHQWRRRWINFKTLISDSSVHTKCTTTEILFSCPLFGYNGFFKFWNILLNF